MKTPEDFKTTLFLTDGERIRTMRQLSRVFCEVDNSVEGNSFSLEEMRRELPDLAELYKLVGGV